MVTRSKLGGKSVHSGHDPHDSQSALELEESQQKAFLERECAGDKKLR
jgi:hypothetical protein